MRHWQIKKKNFPVDEFSRTTAPIVMVTRHVDTASKVLATAAVLVYGCGLLITSIYYSQYGFLDLNPLRPRPALAGLCFLALYAAAYTLFAGTIQMPSRFNKYPSSPSKLACYGLGFTTGAVFLTSLFSWVFDLPVRKQFISGWTFYGAVLTWPLVFCGLEGKVRHSVVIAVTSGYLLLIYGLTVRDALFHRAPFSNVYLFLWFVISTYVCLSLLQDKVRNCRSMDYRLFFLFLTSLLLFAKYYYPHLKSSWGGGEPLGVTVYLIKDHPIGAGKIVASLIEDSDEGIYVVAKGETKASFIPRISVSMIYYSDSSLSTLKISLSGK